MREHPHVAAVRQFNRFYTRQFGFLDRYLDSPFSLAEARVLYELRYRPDAPGASDLAQDLGLDRGYLSRILRGFARRGLITRTTPVHDARRAHLALSAKGRRVFDTLDRRSSRDVRALIDQLPAPTRASVVDAMRAIESSFARSPSAAEPSTPSDASTASARSAQSAISAHSASASSASYTIRNHRPGDMGWVTHRHGVLYWEEYGWDKRFEALVARICADFIDHFDPERERCWIAERDGEILGTIFCVKKSKSVAKLRLLLVEPSARGLGVGTRLVDECIAFARARGYKRLTLWTQNNLHAARRIYQRAGFTLTSEEKHRSFGKQLVAQNWDLELAGSR